MLNGLVYGLLLQPPDCLSDDILLQRITSTADDKPRKATVICTLPGQPMFLLLVLLVPLSKKKKSTVVPCLYVLVVPRSQS